MFESDDYDQVLSQIDFPETSSCLQLVHCGIGLNIQKGDSPHRKHLNIVEIAGEKDFHANSPNESFSDPNSRFKRESSFVNKSGRIDHKISHLNDKTVDIQTNTSSEINNLSDIKYIASNDNYHNITTNKLSDNTLPLKHVKRKIINSHFDLKNKRKFPGPAGLLTGSFEQKENETISQVELFSQDIDFTQNYLQSDVFETPLWKRLLEDTKSLNDINTIKAIKHQALTGNLHRKKAQIVIAFVESVDRSVIDPLITLRDKTGNIKCTLHRDAWAAFSLYIVAECCALVLWKPTVLTTGSTFKKHYLNITLSNLSAIYSSAVFSEEESLPNDFHKICNEDYTVIKMERNNLDLDQFSNSEVADENFLDNLDDVFSDEMF